MTANHEGCVATEKKKELKYQASLLAVMAAAVPCHGPFSNWCCDEEGCEVFWTAGNSQEHMD